MNRLASLAIVGCVVAALGCHHDAGGPAGAVGPSHSTSPLLADVPADTPYVLAGIDPWDDAIKSRMVRELDTQFTALLAKADEPTADPETRRANAAAKALYAEVHGHASWSEALGLAPTGRFVVYGLSLWPVARLEVADPARLRGVIERISTIAIGAPVPTQELSGHPYWSIPVGKVTAIIAVLDHDAVVALVPTANATAMLPRVLGLEHPAHSLADSRALDTLRATHHLNGAFLGYGDVRAILDIVTGHATGWNHDLAGDLVGAIKLSPACVADLDRAAALVPRFAYGYHTFDTHGFSASLIAETTPAVSAALGKLGTAVPGVTASPAPGPMFAMGAAIDGDAALALLRDLAVGVQAHPFECPQLTALNGAIAELAGEVGKLPPMLQGLRGGALVVDDATASPIGGAGHVMIVGAHVSELVTMLLGKVPGFGTVAVARTGLPVWLPIVQLGLPGLKSAHLVVTGDRAVIAVGADSATAAVALATAHAPDHSPLFVLSYDVAKVRERFPSFAGGSAFATLASMHEITMRLDLQPDGLSFDMDATWSLTP